MQDLISFEEAIEASGALRRTILLGNGFSIAQAGGRFSYPNLLEKSGLGEGTPIRNAFQRLNTADFEIVVKALEDASQIEAAYKDDFRAKTFSTDAAEVREALIRAITEVHPGAHFEVPEAQCATCAKFLVPFDTIHAELRSVALLGDSSSRRHEGLSRRIRTHRAGRRRFPYV